MDVQQQAWTARASGWMRRMAVRGESLTPAQEAAAITAACILVAAALILPLVLPGKTFSFIYVHDMMIFFDGADRILDGQMPNRDFHTPLGLLAYLLPAIGLWLGGSLGSMMPLATAAFALIYLPMLIYVCVSRLPLAYGLIFSAFALALVVGPASIGEMLPSFGMFYNRWGYALLALLFLLVLPPIRLRPRFWLDGLVAGLVLLLCFYLKISYFAIAAGFTLLLLLFRESRGIAIAAFAIALVGVGLGHLAWGGTGGYFADIGTAARVTGAVRASALGLVRMAIQNAAMILPFVLVLGLAALRGLPLRTILLCLVMAGAGLLLYNQNFQEPGIMTMVPAAIVAALHLSRTARSGPGGNHRYSLAALLLIATMALPPAVLAAESVLMHSWMSIRGGDPAEYLAEIDGFMAQEVSKPPQGADFAEGRDAYRAGGADIAALKLIRVQALRQVLAQPEYLWTLDDGARLLREDPRLSGKVFTLDMANPFNALVGREGPRGVDSWYHAGRSFNETTYRSPEEALAEVNVVMVPKAPVQPVSHALLAELYGPYLARNFQPVATSDYWVAYRRQP